MVVNFIKFINLGGFSLNMTQVLLTDLCNLSCGHCLYDDKQGHMSLDTLVSTVEFLSKSKMYPKLKKDGVYLSGGEISIYPHLKEAVQLFAEKNIHVSLFTNAIFAQKNTIKLKDFDLPASKLNRLIHEKLDYIVGENIFGEEVDIQFRLARYLTGDVVSAIQEYAPLDYFLSHINFAIQIKDFSKWINELNVDLPDGCKAIKQVLIGWDYEHYNEMIRLGLTEPFAETNSLRKEVESKLGISIHMTQGDYPAYVGRARNFSNFSEDDPVFGTDTRPPLSVLSSYYNQHKGKSEYITDSLKGLLDLMYKNNWTLPEGSGLRNFVLKRLSTCHCLYTNGAMIYPDGSFKNCASGVSPHFLNSDHTINPEYSNFAKFFVNDENGVGRGGPLGVARQAGIAEKEIYETFIDKGPCGLCDKVMRYKQTK